MISSDYIPRGIVISKSMCEFNDSKSISFSISIARKCDFMNNKFFVAVIEMPFLELSGFSLCCGQNAIKKPNNVLLEFPRFHNETE